MNKLWYVRRKGQVKGPFPAAQVSRFVLLGRIRDTDELSSDQKIWAPLPQVPELIPQAVRDGAGQDVLTSLRCREDERGLHQRRSRSQTPGAVAADERTGKDRRAPEDAETLSLREAKSRLLAEKRSRRDNYLPRVAGTALALVLILGLALMLVPAPDEDAPACDAPPGPAVNWSNCRMEDLSVTRKDLSGARITNAKLRQANLFGSKLTGADLAYTDLVKANLSYADLNGANLKGTNLTGADLAYANLSGADLSFADLSQAVLGGAVLNGAQLSSAVWLDGRICVPGSVGQCLLPQAQASPN